MRKNYIFQITATRYDNGIKIYEYIRLAKSKMKAIQFIMDSRFLHENRNNNFKKFPELTIDTHCKNYSHYRLDFNDIQYHWYLIRIECL